MATSLSSTPELGQSLPTSPNFPLQWANPAQVRQLWMLDRMHFNTLVLPLVADVYQRQVASGFNQTAERYRLPVYHEFLYANGYLYGSNPPTAAPPEFVQKALNRLSRVAPRLFKSVQSQIVKRHDYQVYGLCGTDHRNIKCAMATELATRHPTASNILAQF